MSASEESVAGLGGQIDKLVSDIHSPLEALVHSFTDEAYRAIMETVQDYLRDNAEYNVRQSVDAANQRAQYFHSALKAILDYRAPVHIEDADHRARMASSERHAIAYAAINGHWSPTKAATLAESVR